MDARIPVRVSDCRCPESPHDDGDFVYLSPTVPMSLGQASERLFAKLGESVRAALADGRSIEAIQEDVEDKLGTLFVRHGVVGWNLEYLNGKGTPEPRPLDVEALIADWSLSRPVAEEADRLYATAVLAPFQQAAARQSPSGQTGATTSPRRTQTRSPRKPSSRTTSAGAR